MTSGGRVDAGTRHQMILAAASELFALRPYDQVTTKQLAEAAGVSEALVFQHFGSKQDLYVAVIEAGVDDFAASFYGIISAVVELPEATEERLEEIFASALEYHLANPGLLRSFLTEPGAEVVRRTFHRVLLEREADVLDLLEGARRSGVLPDVDPRVLLRALLGQPLIFVITEEWLGGTDLGPLDRAALPRELARLWAGFLRTAPAAGTRSRQ